MRDYSDVVVRFTPEEWFDVGRELGDDQSRWGGWQRTLAEVQRRTNRETLQAILPFTLVDKCRELAEENLAKSRGTFQKVFRIIVCAARRSRAQAR